MKEPKKCEAFECVRNTAGKCDLSTADVKYPIPQDCAHRKFLLKQLPWQK